MSADKQGAYTVRFSVVSAVDGYPTNGDFGFTSSGGAPCGGEPEQEQPNEHPDGGGAGSGSGGEGDGGGSSKSDDNSSTTGGGSSKQGASNKRGASNSRERKQLAALIGAAGGQIYAGIMGWTSPPKKRSLLR